MSAEAPSKLVQPQPFGFTLTQAPTSQVSVSAHATHLSLIHI